MEIREISGKKKFAVLKKVAKPQRKKIRVNLRHPRSKTNHQFCSKMRVINLFDSLVTCKIRDNSDIEIGITVVFLQE